MPTLKLVIDASVACAAGTAEHPTSKATRDFLRAVREICHQVVMTPEIAEEWKQHRSQSFARQWQVAMVAQKKLVYLGQVRNDVLRQRISRSARTSKRRGAMERDAPLIEAALATDRVVVSLDREARELYNLLAVDWGPLRSVLWLQPDDNPEEVLEWVRRGAKRAKKKWLLGAQSSAAE